jgi:predicted  nucleic acid-binding Zn-ribbon protein
VPAKDLFVLQELDAQIESLRDELRLAYTLSDGSNAHLEDRTAAARRDSSEVQERLEAREAKRAEVARRLPAALLRRYERLRERHKIRPWVVGLAGAHCGACNLVLPSAFVAGARRSGEPTPCPNCQRLLVWREGQPGGGSP